MKYLPHHIAISVRQLDKSLAFYESLGFRQVHRYDDSIKTNVHLKLGDLVLEIFAFKKNTEKPPLTLRYANNLEDIGVKHLALYTDDVPAARAELRKKGLANADTAIDNSLQDLEYFFIKDPDGIWVEFINDRRYS